MLKIMVYVENFKSTMQFGFWYTMGSTKYNYNN